MEEFIMKKFLAVALVVMMVLSFAACSAKEDPKKKSKGVMTYAEYDAAAIDTEVVVETYVQAKQSWWENKATIYTQDGKPSAQWEIQVLVTEQGHEVLCW